MNKYKVDDYLYARRRKELLEGRVRTLKRTIDAVKAGDINKIDLSSRNGFFYRNTIIDFYGQEAFDNVIKRNALLRKEKNTQKKKEKASYSVSEEVKERRRKSRERKKQIGAEAFKIEQEAEKKRKRKIYREKYNKENPELIKKWQATRREKYGEELKEANRKRYKENKEYRERVNRVNRENLIKRGEPPKVYSAEDKNKIEKGFFLDESKVETRKKYLKNNYNKKETEIEKFLRLNNYKETEKLLLDTELNLENCYVISLKENSIYFSDKNCFYAIYLLNEKAFDLLVKTERGYGFCIIGKNILEEKKQRKMVIKEVFFETLESCKDFLKSLKKGI